MLDVKLRSERVRATRMRLAVMAISIPAFTLFGFYLLWRTGEWALNRFVYENPDFAIRRVEVQTDGVIPAGLLRRWSGVQPGMNLIGLDLASVRRNLELEPMIRSVSIERILPRTLKICVTERRPIAQVNVPRAGVGGGVVISVFQLGASGEVMRPLDPRQRVVPLSQMTNDRLPVITGIHVAQLQTGHGLTQPQAQTALKLIARFNHSPMAGLADMRRVDISSPGVIVVTTADGGKITFGPQDMGEQLRRWRAIYDLGRSRNLAIASLDLAVANNVPVRWMAAAAAPAAREKSTAAQMRRKNV